MHAKRMAAALLLAAPAAHADWHYGQDTHPGTGRTSWYAEIESANTVARQLPYPPGPGSLVIWQSPRAETLVGVSVELGELDCDVKTGCQLLVQFDSDPPIPFTGHSPLEEQTGEATDSVLIKPAERFIDRAGAARRLRVLLPASGAQQWLEFATKAPLRWPAAK